MTTIVTGFGRCGSSMVMRMLDAAGMPVVADSRAVQIDEALRTSGNVANRGMNAPMFLHGSLQPLVQITFNAKADRKAGQASMGFWRDDRFSRECLGVCGL
jgi:hypothetical protein